MNNFAIFLMSFAPKFLLKPLQKHVENPCTIVCSRHFLLLLIGVCSSRKASGEIYLISHPKLGNRGLAMRHNEKACCSVIQIALFD